MAWPRRRRYWRWGMGGWAYPPAYPPMYQYPPPPPQYGYSPAYPPAMSPEEEIEQLEAYKKDLEAEKEDIEEELKEVEARINELKRMLERGPPQP